MDHYAKPLTKLIKELGKLPGIGGKTAQRLAFHILSLPDEEAAAIADAIVNAKEHEILFRMRQPYGYGSMLYMSGHQERSERDMRCGKPQRCSCHGTDKGIPRTVSRSSRSHFPHGGNRS